MSFRLSFTANSKNHPKSIDLLKNPILIAIQITAHNKLQSELKSTETVQYPLFIWCTKNRSTI